MMNKNQSVCIDKPLSYVLIVTTSVYGRQLATTAYQFAQALINRGHCLRQVFFQLDGVTNASNLVNTASDEFNLVTAWKDLAIAHHVELAVCIAAGQRRGVVDYNNVLLQSLPNVNANANDRANLLLPFQQVGLTALAQALLEADRYLKF